MALDNDPNWIQNGLKERYEREDNLVRRPGASFVVKKEYDDGTEYYSEEWWDWKPSDLDRTDTVTFIPMPVPTLMNNRWNDGNGRSMIYLDVNGLGCWLTVGVENTINRFFYNPYIDALNAYNDVLLFQSKGPKYAPWVRGGVGLENTWQQPTPAFTFGYDINGSSLTGAHTEQVQVGEYKGEPQYIMMTKEQAAQWMARGTEAPDDVEKLAKHASKKVREKALEELDARVDRIKQAQKTLKQPTKLEKVVHQLKKINKRK